MNKQYTIREVELRLKNGLLIRADVADLDGAKELLANVHKSGLGEVDHARNGERQDIPSREVNENTNETPLGRMEARAGLPSGTLAKVLAFKDHTPQFLRPQVFKNTTDGVLALLYATETGLKKNLIEYEDFNGIFDHQNLRAGSPLAMLLTNLRNANYLDKKIYADGRRIRLTAKGETKAIEVLEGLVKG